VGSYGQYCPIAKGAEVFAERWTPLIIRELGAGSRHFNDLERGLPGISRSLLSSRLRALERTGIVARRADAGPGRATEYTLTTAGCDLVQVVEALGRWGARWAFTDPRPEELDPVLLLWWVRRRIHGELLPPRKVIVRFEFRGRRTRPLWLVLERPGVSLCMQDPGFDTELVVSADLAAFYRVWLGRISFQDALRDGLVALDGPPALAREFPRWLQWSHLAGAVRAAATSTHAEPEVALRTQRPHRPG